MVAVADINTIWRKKPFEAMASAMPILGLAPHDFLSRRSISVQQESTSDYFECPVTMLPSWASRLAAFSAWQLWRRIQSESTKLQRTTQCLVVTSPHYLHLVERVKSHMPVFYYCSDDYSQYVGWGGEAIQTKEKALVRAVSHSFFVSETLARRAQRDYSISEDQVSVSANASDQHFFKPVREIVVEELLAKYPQLKHPIVGVVGGVNDRLDFDLILTCSNLPQVGSVVLVGGIDPACGDSALKSLRTHPKCLLVGAQPHEELPVWMQTLDVALIPYADTPLNRACSPMRLFDHLASGAPVVATSFCNQVSEFAQSVLIGKSRDEVIQCVIQALSKGDTRSERLARQQEQFKVNTWEVRAQKMLAKFQTYFEQA